MTRYLESGEFRALNGFLADRWDEDRTPFLEFFAVPVDYGTGMQSAYNVEVNIRRFAARYFSQHPGWREDWAPDR